MIATLEGPGGLVDVTRFDPPILRSTLALETDLVAWSQLETAELLKEKLGSLGVNLRSGEKTALQSFEEEFDQAWAQLVGAVEAGEAWSYTVPVFIGKKPFSL